MVKVIGEALLIGNGINLLPCESNKKSLTWSDILSRLNDKNQLGFERLKENGKFPPEIYTILYEGFVVKLKENKDKKIDANIFVARETKKLHHNMIHEEITSLGYRHIITTNFDFTLEKSIDLKNKYIQVVPKSSDISERRFKVLNSNIWHIHGDVDHPPTMILGNYKYGSNIANFQRYIEKTIESVKDAETINVHNKDEAFFYGLSEKNKVTNVVDLFFNHNINIIGLGLGFNEQDLWWLLIKRALCYKYLCNEIRYYYMESKYTSPKDKQFLKLLEKFYVTLVPSKEEDYLKFYKEFISKVPPDYTRVVAQGEVAASKESK